MVITSAAPIQLFDSAVGWGERQGKSLLLQPLQDDTALLDLSWQKKNEEFLHLILRSVIDKKGQQI